ncbi:MAG: hypothetical protein Q8Q59_13300 [Luteolibacter sp.]|jgi:hypothetical protein|nr:hypothetical protein [Luteolibacter sp.]
MDKPRPRFGPGLLEKGHAVHFRCGAPVVEGLRIDIMTRLRGLASFELLRDRRTVVAGADGEVFNLLSVPDLVEAKKAQRAKDWPVIDALVSIHYRENRSQPTAEWIDFWLKKSRSAELTRRFPQETEQLLSARPLLALARDGDLPSLRAALDAEVRVEQEKERQYWEPLKREMEAFRREEREGGGG